MHANSLYHIADSFKKESFFSLIHSLVLISAGTPRDREKSILEGQQHRFHIFEKLGVKFYDLFL